ncbi:MAG TPA: alkaline phosphatase family protein [Burkholderiales bacterium]|nr:alkaline phosphatase family protein [Burkholderiales bacterium]
MIRKAAVASCSALAVALAFSACSTSPRIAHVARAASSQDALATATPIKHLVVIYAENVSFDHYFATYPRAANPAGEPRFTAAVDTPVDIRTLAHDHLLNDNPNATQPFRLDRSQAATADQEHAYTPEQLAYDDGAADRFPKYTGKATSGGPGAFGTKGQVMGYYDGNTVTAVWNFAQHYAMSDNAYTDTYGPSSPGAIEAVAGQTNGMQIVAASKRAYYVANADGSDTMINDVDPAYDVCSNAADQVTMSGANIGDLLNSRDITWGSFMAGFDLSATNANGSTGCKRSTYSQVVHRAVYDYIPHHAWFQYYASTSNPKHLRPSSIARVGYTLESDAQTPEPANHEYALRDFYAAVTAGNFPSVAYLKAPAYQDGHAGYSDPLDEQAFVAKVIDFLEQQRDWNSTAVIVTWDDSDGWYDHAYAQPTHASRDVFADQLNGAGVCGSGARPEGVGGQPVNGRCGPGTRIPFLVISPWAKVNHVDHAQISQASIMRFIEDNWLGGERLGGGSFDASTGSIMGMFDFNGNGGAPKVYLDPETGAILQSPPST